VVTKDKVFSTINAVKVNNNEYVNGTVAAQGPVLPGQEEPRVVFGPFRAEVVKVVRPLAEQLRNKKEYNID